MLPKSNGFKNMLIAIFALLLIMIAYRVNKYSPDKYFSDNQVKLNTIAFYIEQNHLDGYLFYDDKFNIFSSTGTISKCLYKWCDDLPGSEKISLMIKEIWKWVWYNWDGFLVFSLNKNVDEWNKEDNEFVYKKWYFKNKSVWYDRKSSWDESGILYIFNDDWWVITWCYNCLWWGWD